jgi:hypothetical protein
MGANRLRAKELARASAIGGAAGLVGVAVMTVGEKIEQALTKRPNSFVPARALLTLLRRRPRDDGQPPMWNHVMHWSTGALLGGSRGLWSVTGVRDRWPTPGTLRRASPSTRQLRM